MKPKILKFPKNFYWGTATSAYQVEGGIRNDWSKARGKLDAGIACDHYNRYEEDFDLAKKMNNNAHRFSIEWARIEPREGKFDQKEIEHYRKVVKALRKRNLEPFVTLWHYTNPVWFAKKGGWLNKKAPEYFARYVEFVVKNLLDVKFWITLNEPAIYATNAYLKAIRPPEKRNSCKMLRAAMNLIKAHKKTYKLIHGLAPNTQIGIAKHIAFFSGWMNFCLIKYLWNNYFLNKIKNHQDFIGLNYYSRWAFYFFKKVKPQFVSDMGWDIYPKGIYYVLKYLKRYNKPIYITENGLADAKDKKRAKVIVEHLKWTHKAIEEGVDVRGYLHWSLIDNFEWNSRFGPKFGLIEIDYKTLKRIPRPSSKIYAEICKDNAIEI